MLYPASSSSTPEASSADAPTDPSPIPDSTISRLPTEILLQIVSHLRRPLPKPNGCNSHSSIRQNDLTVLMRVSKLFNNLTAAFLYSTAIVDHLGLFRYHLGESSAASGIPSKDELVAHTRNLGLEYGEIPIPTYPQLMRQGRAIYALVSSDWSHRTEWREAEATMMATSVDALIGRCQLDHISTAIYLGGQTYVSRDPRNDPPVGEGKMSTARGGLMRLMLDGLTPRICQRINHGPLSCVTLFCRQEQDRQSLKGRERHRVYIDDTTSPETIPMFPGGHGDFFLSSAESGLPQNRLDLVVRIFMYHIHAREKCWRREGADRYAQLSSDWSLSLDIYIPTLWGSDLLCEHANDEHPMFKRFYTRLGVPKSRSSKDVFRIMRMEDALPCQWCEGNPEVS